MNSQKKGAVRPMVWIGALLWLQGLLACLPAVTRAEDWISWKAPADCPAGDEMETRVRDLVGTEGKPRTMAHIVIDRQTTGYRARISLASAAGMGQRVLYEARCADLADAAALVVALGVTVQPDEPAEPLRWSIAARSGVVMGPLPAPAPGAGLALSVQALLDLEVHANYYLPQTKRLGDGVLWGRMRLLGAGLRLGLPLGWDHLEWVPRVGVDLYHLTAEGHGGASSQVRGNTMWGPAGGLLLRLRPLDDHWAFAVLAEGVVPLHRGRVVFADAGPLHQPSVLAFKLWLAVEVRT